MLLTTPDQIIEALRARKAELQLSNQMVDELCGLANGHWDKIAGPARTRGASLSILMALCGTLGLAVQLVPDPATKVARRWERRNDNRVHDNGRVSKTIVKRARPIVLAQLGSLGGRSWWSRKSPEQRQIHIAALNIARAAKRQTALKRAALIQRLAELEQIGA